MLDYLKPLKEKVEFEKLLALKEERESWKERPHFKEIEQALKSLPDINGPTDYTQRAIQIISNQKAPTEVKALAEKLIPWKKGPFDLFDLKIDAEWRSDFKWERLEKAVGNLEGKRIIDIGCNNGYFMFKMAQHNPELLLGIDPVLPCYAQFSLIQHFAKTPNLYFELFGVEHLSFFKNCFDTIFHMGIVYHHRHPIQQMVDIREALAPGGQVILETIGIPGEESYALFPEDRYANMKNVWFVPTLSCFMNWAKKAKLIDVELICDSEMTTEEQRNTYWAPPPKPSLIDALDPHDHSKTKEGHPAPRRFLISAKKRF
jgi:tRNA (mo5U34)-methyltransferase